MEQLPLLFVPGWDTPREIGQSARHTAWRRGSHTTTGRMRDNGFKALAHIWLVCKTLARGVVQKLHTLSTIGP